MHLSIPGAALDGVAVPAVDLGDVTDNPARMRSSFRVLRCRVSVVRALSDVISA
jgi:hypothetical protein